ncbi:MAG: glutaredoxin domain-containing protein [Anaerolineaceae bacterium]
MDKAEIIFYATEWCPDCIRSRKLLEINHVPYQWINIDKDKTAKQYVRNINHGNASVPTIVFPDGSILVEPSDAELINHLDQNYDYKSIM